MSGYALKAGQLTYDCRYSTMHGMPVTGGRGFRSLKHWGITVSRLKWVPADQTHQVESAAPPAIDAPANHRPAQDHHTLGHGKEPTDSQSAGPELLGI